MGDQDARGRFAVGNKLGAQAARQPRPKRRITNRLHAELSRTDKATGKTIEHLIAEKLISMALGGDLGAIQEINNRVEGKVAQAVKISGGERPVGVITAIMTAQEAATVYRNMLRELDDEYSGEGDEMDEAPGVSSAEH
jgi:hypothetical protein